MRRWWHEHVWHVCCGYREPWCVLDAINHCCLRRLRIGYVCDRHDAVILRGT